ncbi:MAG: hypothetical protein V2A71_00190, partial [Candidatus Eisenbacteria bacterium]
LVSREPVVGDVSYRFVDCNVLASAEYGYWIGLNDSASPLYGPVFVRTSSGPAGPELHVVSRNPAGSRLGLSLKLPDGPVRETVSLRVFDILGRVVRTLYEGRPGEPVLLEWDLKDYCGRDVGPGVYFLHLEWCRGATTKKVVVLRP